VLDDLDEDALVRVLKEPRNSLVKQYKELLSMDSVELEFTDEALHAIARKTIERKTGARGLRSVMEGILLPVMYDVPNDPTIIRVTIDKDTVEGGEAHLEYGAVRKRYKNQTAQSGYLTLQTAGKGCPVKCFGFGGAFFAICLFRARSCGIILKSG